MIHDDDELLRLDEVTPKVHLAPFWITWWSRGVHETIGRRRSIDIATLVEWWTSPPAPTPGDKGKQHAWSAATFRGGRRGLANVEQVTALVFDFDGAVVPMRDVLAALPIACVGHTSWSHGTKPGERFRVFVPCDRPMTVREHARLWMLFADVFMGIGAPLDVTTKDASRLWFVPCDRPGYDAHAILDREVLDVDEALTIAPREREREIRDVVDDPRAAVRQKGLGHEPRASAIDRASRYLASMPPAIQGSWGGTAMYKTALALVHGFALDEATAFALLAREYNPRCKPPRSAKYLARKVNEAAKATRVGPPGYLLRERTR
ncbi:MAG: hypothetical protein FWD69_01945 [Polyangiaceae bacterium]|nr:hypothetical protein [Polyangiaceae bacterium]